MTDLSRRIAGLSPEKRAVLERMLREKAAPPVAALRPRPRTGAPLPCSFAQQRLWFLDRLEPGMPAYVIVTAPRLPGALDVNALERSIREIVRRHEVLRTTFLESDGEPLQVIADDVEIPLAQADFRSLPRARAELEARRRAAEEAQRPFDLERGPLLRTTLVRVTAKTNILLMAMHHIVTDGWSMKVLFHELETLYSAFAAGLPSPLPPLAVQYADFAMWQREWLTGEVLVGQVAYWRQQLAALPQLELPTDFPRPAVKSYRGSSHAWEVPPRLARALRELSRAEGVTMFMALLAIFATLLSRYTGQTDIAFGTPMANRTRAEIEGLLGFFVNTLVLRTDLSGTPSFRTLLARVRDTALGAYAHQDLPFERLVEELQPPRDLSRNPLFDVMFQLQSSANARAYASDGGSTKAVAPRTVSVFDLSLDMWESDDGLAAQFEYSRDLFDHGTIERMAEHFVTLLRGAVADPDRPLATLPILTPAERRRILVDWNDTAAPLPDRRVHELFEQQAARTPDAWAVRGALTYGALDRRANRLAEHLRARGIGRESLVAVLLPHSADLIAALLGVLKAGAAYLPIDPEAPAARVESLLSDARAALVLDAAAMASFEAERQASARRRPGGLKSAAPPSPDDLAYVIYTSGSTGSPKGVEITHRSLVNHALAIGEAFALGADDCVLQFASAAFDVAGEEIYPALLHGAAIVPASEAARRSAEGLLTQLDGDGVTVLNLPTPLWEAWMPELTAARLPLRLLVVGSERAAPGTLARWRQRVSPQVRLMHGYGVTEATITSLLGVVSDEQEDLPIGRPIANTQAYVLDAHGQPVPAGVTGELHLGGAGLARGYRGRPDLTMMRFVAHPFAKKARLYRTGDRVRYRPDGQLEFLGRLDDQIKLHGFRIEPAEIEAALMRHPAVAEARVLKREDTPGHPRLVAYLVGRTATPPAADACSRFLREQFPEYMIPASYVWLRQLPLTKHGKLDRSALPAPGPARPELETRYAPPQDQLERTIAQVWCDVLRLESVGRDDNFFDLGGRSLLLVRSHSQLRRLIGEHVSILDLFRRPTIRSLAAHLRGETE